MKKMILSVGTLGLGMLLVGCGANPVQPSSPTPEQSNQTETTTSRVDDSQASEPSSAANNQETQSKPSVTIAEAIEIFQKEYAGADITSLDIDTSFGKWVYKIEGVDDLKEYDLKIDATTKAILEREEDQLDNDDKNGIKRQEEKLDLSNLLSLDEITKIALEQTQGGQVTDWDLDRDNGVTHWDVDVKNGKQEATVKINAQTGEVLEVELDD
ncbi:PepSY domain-containing protein [Enterococcus sp.]|uniref:PepSY domain-containing protein n=1 Tax=Enterococcus sp. TaxID=35783 RepID=UPI002FC7766C